MPRVPLPHLRVRRPSLGSALLGVVRRHPRPVAGAGATALTGLAGWWLGPPLRDYFVAALAMDSERGALLASVLLVTLCTAVVSAASRQVGAARIGGLVGFVAIQVVPFLLRASTTPPTPGLQARPDIAGWILQPLGMLLLAAIGVLVGAALGTGLSRDVAQLPALLRRRRLWPALAVGLAVAVVAGSAATTALQNGPLGALVNYGVAGSPDPTATARTTPTANPALPAATTPPDLTAMLRAPSSIQDLVVSGRVVIVYVPGIYAEDPSIRLPVLYLLHGSPGDPQEWLTGIQLQGVLDQMIAAGSIPPLLAVMPDGNGINSEDTEWGNTAAHGAIETWLVDQVIPAVDSRFRTLGVAYRGIAGLSSGGFGALNIAFQHPGDFTWAASYSGYFVARPHFFASAQANSPLDTAATVPAAERMPLYIGVGAQDYEYTAGTARFVATLRHLGWPSVYAQTVPGGHGYEAWRTQLVQSLLWLDRLWGSEPWAAAPPGSG
jgi:enterochelin esterase-like enzyme